MYKSYNLSTFYVTIQPRAALTTSPSGLAVKRTVAGDYNRIKSRGMGKKSTDYAINLTSFIDF